MTPALNLEELTLDSGSHQPGDGQMCVMEAAAFMAGEPWSDHPASGGGGGGPVTRTAWRSVHPDLRSSHGYRWPWPGGEAVAPIPDGAEFTHGDPFTRWPEGFDPAAAGVRS